MGQEELQFPSDSGDSRDSLDPCDSGDKPSKQTRRSFLLESIAAALMTGCGNALREVISQEIVPQQSDLREVLTYDNFVNNRPDDAPKYGKPLDSRAMERILEEFEAQRAEIMSKGKEQEEFFLSVCEELRQNRWIITQDLEDKIKSAMEAKFPEVEVNTDVNGCMVALRASSQGNSVFIIWTGKIPIILEYYDPTTRILLRKRIDIESEQYEKILQAQMIIESLGKEHYSRRINMEPLERGIEVSLLESVWSGNREINIYRINDKIVLIRYHSNIGGVRIYKEWEKPDFRSQL